MTPISYTYKVAVFVNMNGPFIDRMFIHDAVTREDKVYEREDEEHKRNDGKDEWNVDGFCIRLGNHGIKITEAAAMRRPRHAAGANTPDTALRF